MSAGGAGGQGFTLDPDAATTAAGKLNIAADQLEDAGKALADALAAEGACWGDDESGQEFAKDYVPGAEGAVKAFTSIVEGIRALKTNVETAVQSMEGADETVRGVLKEGGGV
ncbi:WXG100 family type VII secretion target [Amycolatopsis lurida]